MDTSTHSSWLSRTVVAAALGLSVDSVRVILKKAPAGLEPVKTDVVRLSDECIGWLLRELGVPEAGFIQKMRAPSEGQASTQGDPSLAVAGVLLARCPNPIFWRARVNGRVVTVRESRPSIRARLRQQMAVRLYPVSGQTYYSLKP